MSTSLPSSLTALDWMFAMKSSSMLSGLLASKNVDALATAAESAHPENHEGQESGGHPPHAEFPSYGDGDFSFGLLEIPLVLISMPVLSSLVEDVLKDYPAVMLYSKALIYMGGIAWLLFRSMGGSLLGYLFTGSGLLFLSLLVVVGFFLLLVSHKK